jgi:alpha-acetolactate decarboxylase
MGTIANSNVYLCAAVNALVEGIYEEKIPFTEVKKHSGHLLECRSRQAEVGMQLLSKLELGLPMSEAYLQ